MFYNGKLLIIDGALAISQNCCCGGCVTCISPATIEWSNANTDRFASPCELTIDTFASKYCFSTAGNIFDLECDETAIDFDTGWNQDTEAVVGCNGLCYENPLLSMSHTLHPISVDNVAAGTISSNAIPAFTLTIDFTSMFQDFPDEECWMFYYTREYNSAEKKRWDCDYQTSPYDSRSYRAKLKIYAVKHCCCSDNVAESIVDITTDYLTGVTVDTAGAQEIGTADYWLLANEDEAGLAIIPPIFNPTLSVSCLDECPPVV